MIVFPEKLIVVVPKVEAFTIKTFSDDEIQARPAFAVDSTKKTLVSRARNWARNYDKHDRSKGYTETTVPNDSFEVRIYGYEFRNYAKRFVFKVVTNGLTYDLYEKEVFDVMLKEGISAGGIVNCKFVWASINNRMQMVRENRKNEEMIKDIIT